MWTRRQCSSEDSTDYDRGARHSWGIRHCDHPLRKAAQLYSRSHGHSQNQYHIKPYKCRRQKGGAQKKRRKDDAARMNRHLMSRKIRNERTKRRNKRMLRQKKMKAAGQSHGRTLNTMAGSTLEGSVANICLRVSSFKRSCARLTAAATSSSIALGPSFPIEGLTLRLTRRPSAASVALTSPFPASPTTCVEESARLADDNA